ncbi:hypothetical protein CL614_08460 [archaeon]|nr:hypothetical protein [archaeon]|tara:strand:+ start:2145 stop:2366 length:222 start_codon:yes stop_codon:yes gene_type:complete
MNLGDLHGNFERELDIDESLGRIVQEHSASTEYRKCAGCGPEGGIVIGKGVTSNNIVYCSTQCRDKYERKPRA